MPEVRDMNSSTLKGRKQIKKNGVPSPQLNNTPNQIQVNHGNAPLLAVKLLELILEEIRIINKKFDHIGKVVETK